MNNPSDLKPIINPEILPELKNGVNNICKIGKVLINQFRIEEAIYYIDLLIEIKSLMEGTMDKSGAEANLNDLIGCLRDKLNFILEKFR